MTFLRFLLTTAVLGIGQAASAYESPAHVVVVTQDGYEIRDYAAFLVAETAVEGSFDRGRNPAFRRLFGYISGANSGERKIAMTVPVIQQPGRGDRVAMTVPVTTATGPDGGEVMQFMLPRAFDSSTAPLPSDPQVRLRELPAERLAVRRYSGRSSEAGFMREREALMAQLASDGLEPAGPARFAVYSGPLTPWFVRRNEVMVPLAADALPAPR